MAGHKHRECFSKSKSATRAGVWIGPTMKQRISSRSLEIIPFQAVGMHAQQYVHETVLCQLPKMNNIVDIPPISEIYQNSNSDSEPNIACNLAHQLPPLSLIYHHHHALESFDVQANEDPVTCFTDPDRKVSSQFFGEYANYSETVVGQFGQSETSYESRYSSCQLPAPPPYPFAQQLLPTVASNVDLLPAASSNVDGSSENGLYYYYTTNAFPVQELASDGCQQSRYETPSPNPSQFFEISDELRSPSVESDQTIYSNLNGKPKKQRRRVPTLAQRKAANIRERRRMYNLNGAFDMLRKTVPIFAYEKHLSRIETLKLAIGYIHFMKELLQTPIAEAHRKYANAPEEMNLKWAVQL